MIKYRKKPVVVEAVIWDGDKDKFESFIIATSWSIDDNNEIRIMTLEGVMFGRIGDYIIKGVQGEYYPCKPDIFAATYEIVDIFDLNPDRTIAELSEMTGKSTSELKQLIMEAPQAKIWGGPIA
jgi:hypothetical protein